MVACGDSRPTGILSQPIGILSQPTGILSLSKDAATQPAPFDRLRTLGGAYANGKHFRCFDCLLYQRQELSFVADVGDELAVEVLARPPRRVQARVVRRLR